MPTLTTADETYLRMAIELSRRALEDQGKTPFGAILVLLATGSSDRALSEAGADESLRTLATDVLRDWAENFPGPVTPKY